MITIEDIKSGDIITTVASDDNSKWVFIYKGVNEDGILSHCSLCMDNNEVFFNLGLLIRHKNIGTLVKSSDYEIKLFYDALINEYKEYDPDWYRYFTDSSYFEIGDWFGNKAGVEFDDKHGYPEFIYAFRDYAWNSLCKEIGMEEACTDYVAPKMVKQEEFIKKAYDWLESHTDLRKEDLGYFVEYMKG